MISKRIACHPANDSYARLANYIAGHDHTREQKNVRTYTPQHHPGELGNLAENRLRRLSELGLAHRQGREGEERSGASLLSVDARPDRQAHAGLRRDADRAAGEKCLLKWASGCWAGDDYELGIREVADTQALNTRTTKEKTYHLIVSFRPEDAPRLTPDDYRAIEERFAAALGLAEHQRHCGVHINTENVHMHVAYNLIHPEKLTRVEPWRDYVARDKLCRELEKEYGLVVDNGREKRPEKTLGSAAATVEAHSGRQSFEGYAQEQASEIVAGLDSLQTWEELHTLLAERGLVLQKRGAGLVIRNRHGKQMTKASAADRALSLKKLEERFGRFAAADKEKMPESRVRYGAAPLQKAPNRGELWEEFQAARQEQRERLEASKRKWRDYCDDLQRRPVGRRARSAGLKMARQYAAQERHQLTVGYPANWMDFLRQKAAQGNETALAVLRSRHEEFAPEQFAAEQEKIQRQTDLQARKTEILERKGVSDRLKKTLLSDALMRSIAPGATMKISRHGVIIYTLPDGGSICDTGRRISFSESARETALAYMAAKWHVRRLEKDGKGRAVLVLSDGQKIVDEGQRQFERPAASRQRQREQGRGR